MEREIIYTKQLIYDKLPVEFSRKGFTKLNGVKTWIFRDMLARVVTDIAEKTTENIINH